MSVMAGLMRMTKAELCDVCEFIGAMDFNRYMTKNDLCLVIIDRITVQPTPTTEHTKTQHTNTHRLYVLRLPQLVQLLVPTLPRRLHRMPNIFLPKIKIFFKTNKNIF